LVVLVRLEGVDVVVPVTVAVLFDLLRDAFSHDAMPNAIA
jgi:hypothetical protein